MKNSILIAMSMLTLSVPALAQDTTTVEPKDDAATTGVTTKTTAASKTTTSAPAKSPCWNWGVQIIPHQKARRL